MEASSSTHSHPQHQAMSGPPATPSHPSLLPAISPSMGMEQTPAPLHSLPPHLQSSLTRPGSAQSQHVSPHGHLGHHGPPIPQPQFIVPPGHSMHTPTQANSMQPPQSRHQPQTGNVFGVIMGSAPGQVPQSETNAKVYASVYSGIPVYEAMIRGISVMRRSADSWVNATQILKVAGIPKSSRTKILDKEVLPGLHEKVQGGYGKYQGTWIPFERGVELAAQYGVTSYLAPIFDFNPSPSSVSALPVHRDGTERQGVKTPGTGMMSYTPTVPGPSPYAQHLPPPQYGAPDMNMWQPMYGGGMYYPYGPEMGKMPDMSMTPSRNNGNLTSLAPAPDISGMGLPHSHADVYIDQYGQPHQTYAAQYVNGDEAPPAKRQRSDDGDMGDFLPEGEDEPMETQEESLEEEESDDEDSGTSPPLPSSFRLATKPSRPKAHPSTTRTRTKLLAAFSSDEHVDLRASLGITTAEATDVDIDMIIDDQGHTALHWATALAKSDVTIQLIDLGADIHRGNYAGETPLIRAVLTTNYADAGNFSTLLSAITASIQTLDHAHRSVVHHIALIAGVAGRAASARTYMATVLDWVAKEGSELGLPLKTLVDVQDVHGDTALNIAARVGSKALVQLLLDAGADKSRPNKLGLKPVDFGIEVEALQISTAETIVSTLKAEVPKPERKSRDVQKNISAIFETINDTFAAEMTQKQTKLNATENSVRHATKALADKRQQVARAQALVSELEQVKQKIDNVRKALNTVPSQDWSGRSGLSSESRNTPPAAFRPVQLSSPVRPSSRAGDAALPERGAPGSLTRLRRIAAWEDRIALVLQDRMSSLEGESADKAVKYRRLVSLCTKVPQDKVDGSLDILTQAIESDGSSIDLNRVSGLLARMKDVPQTA